MKKNRVLILLVTVAAIAGYFFLFNPALLLIFANGNSGKPDISSSLGPKDQQANSQANVGDEQTIEKLDQLELLAETNEAFRWSVDIEKMNTEGAVYEVQSDRDFRIRYDTDIANQEHQKWSGGKWRWQWAYKEWVENFYSGRGVVGSGWTASAKEYTRPESIRYVNVLGRIIAAEWSKSNDVRKIGNNNLMTWNSMRSDDQLAELAQAIADHLNQ